MPSWQHVATFLAFVVILAVIAFAGQHHETVSVPGGTKVVVVEN